MLARGIAYDSNLCLYLQPALVPLQHGTGIVRLPVFSEDDCHWDLTDGDWAVDRYLDRFLTPRAEDHQRPPVHVCCERDVDRALPAREVAHNHAERRHPRSGSTPNPGTRTFVTTLIEALAERGARFHTLHEIHMMTGGRKPTA